MNTSLKHEKRFEAFTDRAHSQSNRMRKLSDVIKKVLETLDHDHSLTGGEHADPSDSSYNNHSINKESGDYGCKVRERE